MYSDPWFQIADSILKYKNKNKSLPSIDNEDKYIRYMAKWLSIQLSNFTNLEYDKKDKLIEIINII